MIQTEFPVDTEVLRSRIIETARSMNTQRLNVNKSGNVSARCRAEGGALAFLITPSGVPYDDLTPEDISRVTRLPTGEWRDEGPLLPSSEWRLHAAVYESKPEVRAIVRRKLLRFPALSQAFRRFTIWWPCQGRRRFPARRMQRSALRRLRKA